MSQLSDQKSSLFGKPKASNASSSSATASATAKASTTSTASVAPPKAPGKTGGLTTAANSGVASAFVLSPAARARKIEEAKQESEIGMKCLQKTVFQWSPDHLGAAPHFEYSSNAYKAAGELKLARLMMLQSTESNKLSKCVASAALTAVKAAVIAHSMNRSDYASADYLLSAELWEQEGDINKSAEMISKAAIELEDDEPVKALALHTRGKRCFLFLFSSLLRCVLLHVKNATFSCEKLLFQNLPSSPKCSVNRNLSLTITHIM